MLSDPPVPTLADDLVELLEAARSAERALFGRLDDAQMVAPMPGDSWSPQDVLGHLAAWRAIEARRLNASAGLQPPSPDDPPADAPVDDETNAALRDAWIGRSRAATEAEAAASIASLQAAIRASSVEALCECDQLAAGIGANGINHAVGHLGDIARLADDEASFTAFADAVERVVHRGHLPPRDAGVLVYNLACHRSLSAELDDARRLLRSAFARRPDLLEWARTDPDLAALHPELDGLAASA